MRLKDFHEKTNPVLDLFRRKEYVITVDARSPARDGIQQEIRGQAGPAAAARRRQEQT